MTYFKITPFVPRSFGIAIIGRFMLIVILFVIVFLFLFVPVLVFLLATEEDTGRHPIKRV